jgi:hypothetical protein
MAARVVDGREGVPDSEWQQLQAGQSRAQPAIPIATALITKTIVIVAPRCTRRQSPTVRGIVCRALAGRVLSPYYGRQTAMQTSSTSTVPAGQLEG